MLFFYNLLMHLVLPFLPLRLWLRARKNPAYLQRMSERFGCYNINALSESIWVHTVSVGEAIAAVPLIKQLLASYPQVTVVVTTMTPTGADRLRAVFGDKILQIYIPYDYSGAVKRFLRHIKPLILVIIETEIWPNLLHYAAKNKIPTIIANARMSARSFRGYMRIRKFFNQILAEVKMIMAQSQIDADRFLALGIDPSKVETVGNIKFDIEVSSDVITAANVLRDRFGTNKLIWVAASTHALEEEKILTAFEKVFSICDDSMLIIVPRHPERFGEVYNLAINRGFVTAKYSDGSFEAQKANVIIGDVMGKLLLFYALADVAFVGGSLISRGGHNLLEPAALAKPIISGEYLDNFIAISELLSDADALIKVNDERELAFEVIKLLQDEALREKYGAAAFKVVNAHRGATEKIMRVAQELLLV